VFVGIVSDTQWVKFCDAFGFNEFAADEILATNNGRVAARDILLPAVEACFRALPKQVLMDKLENTGLPFAPIATPHDLFDDPHLNAAGGLLEVRLPGGETTRLPALPLEFSGRRPGLRRDIPAESADADEVLAGMGLDMAQIAQLREQNIIR